VLVGGDDSDERKKLAKDIEQSLFDMGNVVYFLGIGNVLYGVDADLERDADNRTEHMRRLAEVANLMLDAGVILIATAADLTRDDVELIKASIEPDRLEIVWVGDASRADLAHDLLVPAAGVPEAIEEVKRLLQQKGIIFRPW
jgi:bifunctional enzyme CysN/CysC